MKQQSIKIFQLEPFQIALYVYSSVHIYMMLCYLTLYDLFGLMFSGQKYLTPKFNIVTTVYLYFFSQLKPFLIIFQLRYFHLYNFYLEKNLFACQCIHYESENIFTKIKFSSNVMLEEEYLTE